MLFNSLEFVILVLLVSIFSKLFISKRIKGFILLIASLIFYSSDNISSINLLIGVILISYFSGLIFQITERLIFYYIALIVLIGALVYFKYMGMFSSFIELENIPLLPIGLSFFIFQAISYLIDIRRGEIKASRSLLDYSVYLSFFPQLVSGPIERFERLRYELNNFGNQKYQDEVDGIKLFVYGAFLKFVLSNNLAVYETTVYGNIENHNTITLVSASIVYFWRIYFDFKSYTLMARGAAQFLGVKLVRNFNRPYMAVSLRDFWRRWHMSLSDWLTRYLYFSLGGNRISNIVTYRNLFLTMLIGGLWHGASLSFLLWGALHGLALIVERVLKLENTRVSRFWTIGVVWFLWIPFRLNTDEFFLFTRKLLTSYETWEVYFISFSYILLIIVSILSYRLIRFLNFKNIAPLYLVAFELLFIVLLRGSDVSFVYFKF
jgi:alginate O-acetyltransferase complex protein AlgI